MGSFFQPFAGALSPKVFAALVASVSTLDTSVTGLKDTITSTNKPWLAATFIDVPVLTLGQVIERPIVFDVPAPAADYTVVLPLFGLGSSTVDVSVKPNSATTTGLIVVIKAKALLAVSTGKVLVFADRSAHQ